VSNAVMFRSLPIRNAQDVVVLQWSANKQPQYHWYSNYGDTKTEARAYRGSANPTGTSFSHRFLQEVEKANVFTGVAAFASGGPMALSGNGPATNIRGQAVSGDFFRTLGIFPAIGRVLEPGDDRPSAPPAVVLNYSYW